MLDGSPRRKGLDNKTARHRRRTDSMIRRNFRYSLLLILTMLGQALAVRAQETPGKEFDDYVNKALKDWEVPGLAIAVVKNDKLVFAKGYGVRKLGDPAPVDENTIFAI